nr:MAG TPA: hypothetical protein [Caudoviricetes sp.]
MSSRNLTSIFHLVFTYIRCPTLNPLILGYVVPA